MIELVIVIAIVGVIAAIAIPRASSGADQSKVRSLQATTRGLQFATDIYTSDHAERTPAHDEVGDVQKDGDAFLSRLLKPTFEDGTLDDKGPLGPYLSSTPVNPFSSCNAVRITDSEDAEGCGFRFDPMRMLVRHDNSTWTGISKHFLSH